MRWLDLLSYFAGGALLANAVPHVVSGLLGRSFQTPFAKPPGRGLSSATVNLLWGFANLVTGYGLVCRVGAFDAHDTADVAPRGWGARRRGKCPPTFVCRRVTLFQSCFAAGADFAAPGP